MSANRHRPHLMILPEDDANRQMAIGFTLGLDEIVSRQVQVLPVAGGWNAVLDQFVSDKVSRMDRYNACFMLLLIDFDGKPDRLATAKERIPPSVAERVFILGVSTEPERLKAATAKSYEAIGSALADECRTGTETLWSHELLRHNAGEVERLRERVRPILFEPIS